MKVFAVFVVCLAVAVAVPVPTEEQEQQQNSLASVDANTQGDSNQESAADRLKRFIFFSKGFYPYAYPYYAAPVVKYVAAAPAVQYVAAAPAVTVQKTGNFYRFKNFCLLFSKKKLF